MTPTRGDQRSQEAAEPIAFHFGRGPKPGPLFGLSLSQAAIALGSVTVAFLLITTFGGVGGIMAAVLIVATGTVVALRAPLLWRAVTFRVERSKERALMAGVRGSDARASRRRKALVELVLSNAREGGSEVIDRRSGRRSFGFRLPDLELAMASPEESGGHALHFGAALPAIADAVGVSSTLRWQVDIRCSEALDTSFPRGRVEANAPLFKRLQSCSFATTSTLWVSSGRASGRTGARSSGRGTGHDASIATMPRRIDELFPGSVGSCVPLDAVGVATALSLVTPQGFGSSVSGSLALYRDEVSVRADEIAVEGGVLSFFQLAEWPSGPVGGGFLLELFRPEPPERSVFTIMRPIDRQDSSRRSAVARSESIANRSMLSRAGFMERSSSRLQHTTLERQEAEVARGSIMFDYDLFICIAARTRIGMISSLQRFEAIASRSGCLFRRARNRQLELLTEFLLGGG